VKWAAQRTHRSSIPVTGGTRRIRHRNAGKSGIQGSAPDEFSSCDHGQAPNTPDLSISCEMVSPLGNQPPPEHEQFPNGEKRSKDHPCRVEPTKSAGRCQSCPCDPRCSDLPDQSTGNGPCSARGGDCCPLLPPSPWNRATHSRESSVLVSQKILNSRPAHLIYARACRRYPATSLMKR
jgi:hypothetical protein